MRLRFLCTLAVLIPSSALAQTSQFPSGNNSISITTGNTFQAIAPRGQTMRSLTIQNNNAGDSCYIDVTGVTTAGTTTLSTNVTTVGGASMTAQKATIVLTPSQSYSRYYPYLPNGPINGTCTTAGDSIYVDWQ